MLGIILVLESGCPGPGRLLGLRRPRTATNTEAAKRGGPSTFKSVHTAFTQDGQTDGHPGALAKGTQGRKNTAETRPIRPVSPRGATGVLLDGEPSTRANVRPLASEETRRPRAEWLSRAQLPRDSVPSQPRGRAVFDSLHKYTFAIPSLYENCALGELLDGNVTTSGSVKRRQCVKYAQNLRLDAQKAKTMRQMMHSIIPLTHKPNMPSVNLTHKVHSCGVNNSILPNF